MPLLFLRRFCFAKARKRIGELPAKEVRVYVYERLFFHGLGSLPATIYLAAEALKCAFNNQDNDEGNDVKTCRTVLVPQISICLMLAFFLIARLVFVPISSIQLSYEILARFKGLV